MQADLRAPLEGIADPIALLEGMFAHSPVPYIIFKADGHVLLFNRAYREMFGASPPPEYNLFKDEVSARTGLAESVTRAFSGETVRSPTVWYDPKALEHVEVLEAKRVAISCTLFPLWGRRGEVTHVAIAFQDVTSQIEARERAEAERDELKAAIAQQDQLAAALRASESQLRLITDALPALIALMDKDGRYRFVNRAYEDWFGRPRECWIGRHVSEMLGDESYMSVRPLVERVLAGEAMTVERTLNYRFGGPRDVRISYIPQRDAAGHPDGYVALIADVSDQRRAQNALRESEARLRKLFDSRLIGILYWRLDGGVTDANDALLEIIGYDRSDLENGRINWVEMTPPEYRHLDEAAVESLRATGTHDAFEKVYIRKDGTRVPVFLGGTLFDGSHTEGVTFVLDVSSRKRAEEDLRFLSEVSEQLAASLDLDSTLATLTRCTVAHLADYCIVYARQEEEGPVEAVAMDHRDAGKAELLHELHRRWRPSPDSTHGWPAVLRTGAPEVVPKVTQSELELAASGDAGVLAILRQLDPCSWMSVPLEAHGRIIGVITFASDNAGARRAYGREDVALAKELARRTTTALEKARLFREARDAIRLRDEFLSIASHELKTPLTPLSLKIESLARALTSEPDSRAMVRRRRDVDVMTRQVRRLSDLIGNLLDVSRMSTGRMSFEREQVDLSALVRDIVARFEDAAERAGCPLFVSLDAAVVGYWDKLRLEQVVSNLLSNALRYGPGKPIRIDVTKTTEHAHLVIADEGIGIAADVLPRIFDKFERGVSERNYGGLGLGLFVARQIVEAHGGTVAVESSLGEGARFSVELPLRGE